MPRHIDDVRIVQTRPLLPPAILREEFPVTDAVAEQVERTRCEISDIVHGRSRKLLAIVGPCSIHDTYEALQYAEQLKAIADEVSSKVLVVMRAYFEKPRTTVGWKGFINDPDLDESYRINKGLRLARKLLLEVNSLGMPTGSEFLDLQVPQHIADLTSWVAIGARTTESQVHRELASGLSMPVGFKNTTEGSVTPAADAIGAARNQHWFPSVTKDGVGAIFQTRGNPDCHVILRGGSRTGPNYQAPHVLKAVQILEKRGLPQRVMIDCSHGNSEKDYRRQKDVVADVCEQLRAGSPHIMGIMVESNLVEGSQKLGAREELVGGQSVTDSCIGLDETRNLLLTVAGASQR